MRNESPAQRIVRAGFDAIAEPGRWAGVAAAIAAAVPQEVQVGLRVLDRSAGFERYVAGYGFSDSAIRSYLAHYSRVNPWTGPLVRTPAFLPVLSAQLVSDAAIDASEFCTDWLRPERIGTSGLGLNVAAGNDSPVLQIPRAGQPPAGA